jgi:hypothetical protein
MAGELKNCTICLEDITSDMDFLPCAHVFHRACISDWIVNNPHCPMCKIPIFISSPADLEAYNANRRRRETEAEAENRFFQQLSAGEFDNNGAAILDNINSSPALIYMINNMLISEVPDLQRLVSNEGRFNAHENNLINSFIPANNNYPIYNGNNIYYENFGEIDYEVNDEYNNEYKNANNIEPDEKDEVVRPADNDRPNNEDASAENKQDNIHPDQSTPVQRAPDAENDINYSEQRDIVDVSPDVSVLISQISRQLDNLVQQDSE